MTFYVSLSGLKGAQADLSAISNNVANVNSTAFKKSKAQFGDIFAASPMRRSVSLNATYDGVVLLPWSFAMISTRSFCQTPTQE